MSSQSPSITPKKKPSSDFMSILMESLDNVEKMYASLMNIENKDVDFELARRLCSLGGEANIVTALMLLSKFAVGPVSSTPREMNVLVVPMPSTTIPVECRVEEISSGYYVVFKDKEGMYYCTKYLRHGGEGRYLAFPCPTKEVETP